MTFDGYEWDVPELGVEGYQADTYVADYLGGSLYAAYCERRERECDGPSASELAELESDGPTLGYRPSELTYGSLRLSGTSASLLCHSGSDTACYTQRIQRIDRDHYIKAGDLDALGLPVVHTFKHAEKQDRTDNLHRMIRNIRDTLNSNLVATVEDADMLSAATGLAYGVPDSTMFVTLTYGNMSAESRKDGIRLGTRDDERTAGKDWKVCVADFASFLSSFKYYLKTRFPSYVDRFRWFRMVEPQRDGTFHIHCLFWFVGAPYDKPFLPLRDVVDMWGHGSVKVEACRSVTNIGSYFAAYFDADETAEGKRAEKGSRLGYYPSGARLWGVCRSANRVVTTRLTRDAVEGLLDENGTLASHVNDYSREFRDSSTPYTQYYRRYHFSFSGDSVLSDSLYSYAQAPAAAEPCVSLGKVDSMMYAGALNRARHFRRFADTLSAAGTVISFPDSSFIPYSDTYFLRHPEFLASVDPELSAISGSMALYLYGQRPTHPAVTSFLSSCVPPTPAPVFEDDFWDSTISLFDL